MSSNKNGADKLPEGWILCKSKSNPGRTYYFNKKTGKSLWTQPKAEDGTSKPDRGKPKGKKEKIEKKKKEEVHEKNMKRKSSGAEESTSAKKTKQVKTPEKKEPPNKPAPNKPEELKKSLAITLKKESPKKPTNLPAPLRITPPTTKNIANNRLSLLRAQLDSEAQSGTEEKESFSKTVTLRCSPKPPSDNKAKESKSPLNDTKCSTTHSPSGDSIQSIPSPSQFFAANKIIYSIKAQLPEKSSSKLKPKDTFADIEQGICNQTTEYPSIKHPATPPQFSEASKLVSAIKSKLSYKVAVKDGDVKTFPSAKERMDALRNRLSNDAEQKNDNFLREIVLSKSEAMDVEEYQEDKQPVPRFECRKNRVDIKDNLVLVVDTNVFIHELDVIKNVLNSHIKGYNEQPTLLVPWRVINELDRLKDNNNGNGAICKRARSAMDYLYKSLPENNRIKGQSLRDANSHIYPCEIPDDEILNCCLQQSERGYSVILLSNDKNLSNKASINGVKCITLDGLRPLLENKPQPTVDPDLYASVKHYEGGMYQLLANILENEMRAKYNNLWQHVLFKAPPWTLSDVLQCLLKHWVAVFSEVFPRIQQLISDLRNALKAIEDKSPSSLSQSEVTNFKELCLDIAKKCQIIPEYMELAKTTVDRLLNKTTEERQKSTEETLANEMPVIDAFERLWTMYSSYCAKLSTALGIPHTIEDNVPSNDPLPVLSSKLGIFSNQINMLTQTMRGYLENEDNIEEQTARLAMVFRDSLTLISLDKNAVNNENMRIFCVKCRNMLQEAYTKFSALTELLDICKTNLSNLI